MEDESIPPINDVGFVCPPSLPVLKIEQDDRLALGTSIVMNKHQIEDLEILETGIYCGWHDLIIKDRN
jgi:hypothetical protein